MNYTPSEMMTIAAARALCNDDICFVGIGLPSAAANLARLTHAPQITLIYESGTIGAKPTVLPLSIGDGELCATALTTVSVPEIFRYWLQGGRVTVGFLSGAQIDRFGNLNTTVIGSYAKPKVRLPGGGGAPEIASCAGHFFVMMNHNPRAFVERNDFITSLGNGRMGNERSELGLTTRGPTLVVTDLCTMRPHLQNHELVVDALHPEVTVDQVRKATGWEIRFAENLLETLPPSQLELATLRDLNARTERAHRSAAV